MGVDEVVLGLKGGGMATAITILAFIGIITLVAVVWNWVVKKFGRRRF
jgi:flagellar biogenesis protein FliO